MMIHSAIVFLPFSPLQMKKTTCDNEDHQNPSCFDLFNAIEKLEKIYADVSEGNEWVIEEMKKIKDKADQPSFKKLGEFIEAIVNAWEKFESGSEVDIVKGVLDMISKLAVLSNHPAGLAIKALCSIIGVILTYQKPRQPSVVQQLAKVVHGELVNFNKKLQDQKYHGLRRRVTDQVDQLRTMRPGEKLDDPSLWNDYVQFMGELSNRFESPLPFKYDKVSLSKDPDVADFVTAVVTYCQAYSCFMALLTAVKGKFSGMGGKYKEDEEVVDRKIRCQKEDAKGKLAFLSDEKNLTFLGGLPYEGGKLTKILVLSRNFQCKFLVAEVRRSLGMPEMSKLAKVESAAEKVSRQSVKLKLDERHQVPPGNFFRWMVSSMFGPTFWVQFVNETDFPMKVVSGTVGLFRCHTKLKFVQDIKPHASHQMHLGYVAMPNEFAKYLWNLEFLSTTIFSAGGYLTIYLNGTLNSEREPPVEDARVIEFALSLQQGMGLKRKINIEEKTGNEFTQGQDTYSAMKSGEAKTIYWFDYGQHYMAKAETVITSFNIMIWRFVFQDFDPCKVED